MKNIKQYLISFIFIFAAMGLYASDAADGGRTALPFLKMDMGARYYGMAGAATAYGDDVTAMAFYNPAAVGKIQAFQIAASTYESALDMKYMHAGAAIPIKFLSLSGNGPFTLGFSFYMFDKGDIPFNGQDVKIGDDIALTLSMGENVSSHTWEFMGNSSDVEHYFGANAKYLRSSLPKDTGGKVTAEAFAFDVGYSMVVDNHFGIGVAYKNGGTKVKYIEEKDDLPTTLNAGLFFSIIDVKGIKWDVSGDYIRHLKEAENRVRVGTEAVFLDVLAVRGGVKLMEELDEEYTLGFGLKLFGFEVDFGTILNPQLNDDNRYQVSVAYKFPVSKKESVYKNDEKKRNEYEEYKRRQAEAAAEKANRNNSPILYQ